MMKNVRMLLKVITLMVVLAGFCAVSQAQTTIGKSERKDTSVTKTWDIPETQPSFPGGKQKLMEFLASNTHYPEECLKDSIEGRVVVSFMIERNGEITDAKVVKGVHTAMDQEAVRVIQMMPRWCPGKINGQSRRVKYTLPFTFRLPQKESLDAP